MFLPKNESNSIAKLNILFDKILIDFKILKNSIHNDTSNLYSILTNQIEQLNNFLLHFTGKQKSFYKPFKAASDNGFSGAPSTENIDEANFIHKNNEVIQII
jgi:Zn-finger domain-containing protein